MGGSFPAINRTHESAAHSSPDRVTKALLLCGILYGVVYAVINDVVAATLYEGYSRASQAISELSATGAPTRGLLTAMMPVFTALVIAFGVGVWRASRGRRSLRITGVLLMALGVTFPLWLLAPMTSRAEMVAGTMPANDLGHVVLTALSIAFIMGQIGFGAAAFGKWFRIYAGLTAVTVILFGVLTGLDAPKVPLGEPTPWMGLFERISYAAWLQYLGVLAVVLMRRHGSPHGAATISEGHTTRGRP